MNSDRLLKLAESQFLNKDYKKSLQLYADILKQNPKSNEAKMGVYLSDFGLDNDNEAQALFDYYHTIKDGSADATEIISELIKSLDETNYKINEIIAKHMDMQAEADGIVYDDFKKLIKEEQDFKKVFENIMFSTRVVISNKEDLIDFITKLIEHGFKDMAASYLDDMSMVFPKDQDLLELYKLL